MNSQRGDVKSHGYGRGTGSVRYGQLPRPRRSDESGPHILRKISDWVKRLEPTQLLATLNSQNFVGLLDPKKRLDNKTKVNILKAISKSTEAEDRDMLISFLTSITSKTLFFRLHLNDFLDELESQINDLKQNDDSNVPKEVDEQLQSINDILVTFNTLIMTIPHETTLLLLPLLSLTKRICGINHQMKLSDSSQQLLGEVEKELEKMRVKEKQTRDALSKDKPPNDFREISVTPVVADLEEETSPYLRKNVVNDTYKSADQYLDIHFRLMREDFIRPLRNGVIEYRKAAEVGNRIRRLSDAYIYYNVRIEEMELTEIGLEIRMQFDVSILPKINWRTTKRLIGGSLICFTWNRFEDFIIASVGGKRHETLLENGYFYAVIDPSHETKFLTEINQDPDKQFVAIEPLSYFEAYRHILQTLQTFTEDNFPLKKYIVSVDKDVDKVSYLNKDSTYDLKTLLSSTHSTVNSDELEIVDSADEKMNTQSLDSKLSAKLSKVNILDDTSWPTPDELGMDESQLSSLKDALTNEVSVIQGPPGTGKTYIGLRIVEALMNNRQHWDEDNSSTILVACYTNHALDQFLEGILPFCRNVLRIGGRCKTESLQKYCLNTIKLNTIKRRCGNVENNVVHQIQNCRKAQHKLKMSVNNFLKRINSIRKSLLPSAVLETVKTEINEQQSNSFKSLVKQTQLYAGDDFTIALKEWLDLQSIEKLREETTKEVEEEDEEEVQRLKDERDDDDWQRCDEFYRNNYEVDEEVMDDAKFKRFYKEQMNKDEIMSIEEAREINDVTNLSLKQRWRLYRLWVKLYIKSITNSGSNIFETNQVANVRKKLQMARIEEEVQIARNAKIIGITTTGAAKNRNLISRLKPKILIVEEAAEILESHIITSMTEDTKHLILIGDHIQLKPKPTVHELAVKYRLNVSLFERLIRNDFNCTKLKIQHRMHPSISEHLVPHFYQELENHESVTKYESVKGITKNIFFLDHSKYEAMVKDTQSRYNIYEVDFVFRLCRHLILQGYDSSQITVITMYSAQMFRIRSRMKVFAETREIRVSVVDNYQGEENDIIICSFVRSNVERDIGFLKTPNRINVALSRAKKGFYGIGNFSMFCEVSPDLWKPLTEKLHSRRCIGHQLELYCQNHLESKIKVKAPEDFSHFPEGGCTKPCNQRLPCGHICKKPCHFYDPSHEVNACNERCLNKCCENDHRCQKKCHYPNPCSNCVEQMVKVRDCGHTMKTMCSRDVNLDTCTADCNKILPCGHKCPKRCGEDCSNAICREPTTTTSPCGHDTVTVPCCDKEHAITVSQYCKSFCEQQLKCGHICTSVCGDCRQGRLHKKCAETCNRVLICGHICKAPCANNCPPCNRKCDNICTHDVQCTHKCSSPCNRCRNACNWSCEHCYCKNQCFEQCEQVYRRCSKQLKCNHTCIGINGYECPKICEFCDFEEFEKIETFANKNEKSSYIQLLSCGHLFEANGLYKHLLLQNGSEKVACPKCDSEIEHPLFGMIKTLREVDPKCKNLTHICTKTISCGHQCIGVCGEPCPKKCRICDKEEVETILFGNENEIDARFVELMCNHIFEFGGLKKYLSLENSENSTIQKKDCLLCKNPIRKSLVFNSELQKMIDDVEIVKNKFVGIVEENLVKKKESIDLCDYLNNVMKAKRNQKFPPAIIRTLTKTKKELTMPKLTASDWQRILNLLSVVKEAVELLVKGNFTEEHPFYKRVSDLIVFVNDSPFVNNEQQIADVSFEVTVLKRYRNIFEIKSNERQLKDEVKQLMEKASRLFNLSGKLTEKQSNELKRLVDKAVQLNGGVSAVEKQMILKAMNFGQKGHWFKCPNGHPYCITECGGATETAKCPECKEEIGGTSHRLLDTNTVATDIDNAVMSAYDYSAYGIDN